MTYEAQYAAYLERVESALTALPMTGAPAPLREAMLYSLLSGGKRLRPCLLLASCDMAGGNLDQALPFACAIEMIHTYSLIHDDLPAMDDDAMRRGKPSCHIAFNEATAILAGDGLLNGAYETMSASASPYALKALREIASAAGIGGMIAGQAIDLQSEKQAPSLDTVRQMYLGKTAALLSAPVAAGLLLAGAGEDAVAAGRQYGVALGMAFQIVDDLLDVLGDEKKLGKHTGKDAAAGKMTWVACRGVENARADAEKFISEAVDTLSSHFLGAEFLKTLAKRTLSRVQ